MTDTPPPPPPAAVPPQPLSESDERLYATLGHVGVILLGFVAPLIVWLVFKDRSAFVDDQGKEALNFSILITIAYVVGAITAIILIGFVILLAAFVVTLLFCIQGAIAANKGERYRYPLNWRIVK